MDNMSNETIKISSPSLLMQTARDFAVALAATRQFREFEVAGEKLDQDPAAQDAIQAFQAKQEELKMVQSLNAVTPKEREEFERLRKAFLNQPSIAAYLQAQAGLAAVCQAAGDLLSEQTGLNFASSACASACCG